MFIISILKLMAWAGFSPTDMTPQYYHVLYILAHPLRCGGNKAMPNLIPWAMKGLTPP